MRKVTMFVISLILSSVVTTVLAQDAKPDLPPALKTGVNTVSASNMKPEDQVRIQELIRSVSDIQKDIELAQARIALAQAQLVRVNEVQLPQLENYLRDAYKLPVDKWDWNLQTLTFTKKKE